VERNRLLYVAVEEGVLYFVFRVYVEHTAKEIQYCQSFERVDFSSPESVYLQITILGFKRLRRLILK
jgi:hypothetical protein